MWFSFWRSRDRFTLDQLRYLTDHLMKIQVVDDFNKAFVIEALRSIAELMTYGDQHDSDFFEVFMEKQVMGEFIRILKISKSVIVSVQLLQTMSIMIQNLKSDRSIYYLFSNEHINNLITYSFDFRNEELLSYYMSFLRAISGKLNKDTISLLVKTEKEDIVAFPLYVEAIRFAFHEEGMIRTAVRALTLNIYHVGDVYINKYIASTPHGDYFLNQVKFFRERCVSLNGMVSPTTENQSTESTSIILSAVDEIEDNLYYLNDVVSAGIPDVGTLITDSILKLLTFPTLLPSLRIQVSDGKKFSSVTSLYLLCCILRILKIKDLANTVAAALICSIESFMPNCEATNGFKEDHVETHDKSHVNDEKPSGNLNSSSMIISIPSLSTSSSFQLSCSSASVLRDTLISYITSGNDMQVVGSLSLLATFLQTKELDESMLDALGILPQRKQHKKLLLKALVGNDTGEEQLFASENCTSNDGELNIYLQRLKDQYEVSCSYQDVGQSPRIHRFLVLDALISLFSRKNVSADTLWYGGWLLRQLLPYKETKFNPHHLQSLKDSFKECCSQLSEVQRGPWPDLLIQMICEEWRKCKRAIEASSPRKEPKSMLLPTKKSSSDILPIESSFAAGETMYERVQAFVLLHQLQIFSTGRSLPDHLPILPPTDFPEISRAKSAGLSIFGPKLGTEIKLVDSVPCRIAFERGKERHFNFLATSVGTSGWIILAEVLPQKPSYGNVRVVAPLAGCNPKIDDRFSRWLHLRIRPTTLLLSETAKNASIPKLKSKPTVDGRWTLAFKDDAACKSAFTMIHEEMDLQCSEVERRLKPLISEYT
ncbi:protein TRANSPARENT TESTA 9-like [Bidens hawaiensis]|uniref:protein TRANSPARENT TESTA 9-like n=1 Tax=Bidens hawaiensis TaxID=980011 RepID=UPI0040495C3B